MTARDTGSGSGSGPAAAILRRLPEAVNADPVVRRRGRYFTGAFVFAVGDEEYLLDVEDGRVTGVEKGTREQRRWLFAVRGPEDAWRRHWKPVPPPGYHDLFALTKAHGFSLEGDIRKLMAHLQFVKDLMAAPRRLGEES